MNDPHITSLSYRLKLQEPSAEWNSPPPVTAEREGFVARLEAEGLVLEMHDHYAEVESARQVVRPFLRAWEVSAALDGRRIVFEFESAQVIDRNPPTGEIATAIHDYVDVTATMTLTASGEDEHLIGLYPEPPRAFAVTDDVETLLWRYERFVEGREPLTSWAGFTLSYVEHLLAEGRGDAAAKFNISKDVLRRIGHLAAEVGDLRTARKISPRWEERPHTQEELNFLLAAGKALIRRVGEAAAAEASRVAEANAGQPE